MSKFNNFRNYNPDILETIANLSNDEVFTPPKLANDILDLLPEEVWSNPNLTFLDPAAKTGIFLREITSRLIEGLADQIPDLQERVNHILTKQVFGIGITELTTLIARRTVYCSMTANGKYSICTEFDDEKGNIKFPDTKHNFDEKTGRCEFCGANEGNYNREDGLENYAYSFIHDDIKEVFGNMKFDVIIGNPPYQLETGSGGAQSTPLYNKFIEEAIKLNPKYISMITPSRWFYGGMGLNNFRQVMIADTRLRKMIDYQSSLDCFPSMGINGGINYFLWDNTYDGPCSIVNIRVDGSVNEAERLLKYKDLDVFINDNILFNIIEKNKFADDNEMFSSLVSSAGPYGKLNRKITKNKIKNTDSLIYGHKVRGYIDNKYITNNKFDYDNKIFISLAYGGNINSMQVINKPFIPEQDAICSETYLSIGPFKSNDEANNALNYMQTKFFRAMVYSIKKTQHGTKKAYRFVPMQDWTKSWTDKELYEKYNITKEEEDYIESIIAPMGDQEDQAEVDLVDSEFEDEDGE